VRQAFRQGFISAAPTFSTVNRYIANQDLTPVITDLIERSASRGHKALCHAGTLRDPW
jgi:hypothetical protein